MTRNHETALCSVPDCKKLATKGKVCKAHGGSRRCSYPLCQKFSQTKGLCVAHGGGRRCAFDGCFKLGQCAGFCSAHGGGCRCKVPGCKKFVQAQGYCRTHGRQFLSTATVKRKSTKSKVSADSALNARNVNRQQRVAVALPGNSTLLPFTTSPDTGRWLPSTQPMSSVHLKLLEIRGGLVYDDRMVFPPCYPHFVGEMR